MPVDQPAAVVEQSVLAVLGAEDQSIRAYLATCPLGAPAATIGQWITGLDDFAWHLLQLSPAATWLGEQGLQATLQRLDAMMRDLAGARQQYVEMYQNTVAVQSRWTAIWNDAANFTTQTISEVMLYRQAVFANWVEGYFDVTENRCFDCHRLIGIPGGGYCLDCARRRGLIS